MHVLFRRNPENFQKIKWFPHLVNRVLVPMLNDAVRTLAETGADPGDIDRALKAGAGWPMGPLALIDLAMTGLYLPMESVLFPKYFADHNQPAELGWVLMALSIGGLIGALAYPLLVRRLTRRAILLIAAYRASGGVGDASGLAAAVEVVHAYSLVHDDLPCMDDDDVRRGRPTVHKAFTVPAATAAGLAMVPLAARAACDAALQLVGDAAVAGEIVRTLIERHGAEASAWLPHFITKDQEEEFP